MANFLKFHKLRIANILSNSSQLSTPGNAMTFVEQLPKLEPKDCTQLDNKYFGEIRNNYRIFYLNVLKYWESGSSSGMANLENLRKILAEEMGLVGVAKELDEIIKHPVKNPVRNQWMLDAARVLSQNTGIGTRSDELIELLGLANDAASLKQVEYSLDTFWMEVVNLLYSKDVQPQELLETLQNCGYMEEYNVLQPVLRENLDESERNDEVDALQNANQPNLQTNAKAQEENGSDMDVDLC